MGIIVISAALLSFPKWGWVVIVALAAVALLAAKLARGAAGAERGQYSVRPSILSPAERSLLGVLESLDVPDVRIYAKVRLADIFEVKKELEKNAWQRAFNRIAAKHVDFLFVRKSDGAPVLGIELDDRSHEAEHRKARDQFVRELFQNAGLPLLNIPARASYDPKELARRVNEARNPS